MKKMPPLTLSEHRELSAELLQLRDRLMQLGERLSVRYPMKLVRWPYEAARDLDRLRSALDDRVFTEHRRDTPDEAALLRVYYPERPGTVFSAARERR